MKKKFSHLDAQGRPTMVNVAMKLATFRLAQASAFLRMQPKTIAALRDKTLPKGEAFTVAQIAGIQAAKETHRLIPLCHTLESRNISVHFSIETKGVRIYSEVQTIAPTGPEMEALVACTVAGLTLYDMCKAIDRSMTLESVRLDKKLGGKSEIKTEGLQGKTAVILTLSDRASRGIYADKSGPAALQKLRPLGFKILHKEIVPDDLKKVSSKIKNFCDKLKPDLLLTLGSTGLSVRDIAPEAAALAIDRLVPGIPETLRAQFFPHHPASAFLSRSIAGFRGPTLILNLPGKPSAVEECLNLLTPAFSHIFKTASGQGHE